MIQAIKKFLAWDGLAGGERGFIQAALTAAPFILNALGGIFGKKKKYMDPEELRTKYGAGAISKETQDLSNFILNSPYGQQLLSSAANSGQELQTDLASRAGSAGLDPGSGGESGASTFAAAAAPQAQASLERGVKSNVWQAAMPIAANSVAQRAQLAQSNLAGQNAEPDMWQKIAGAAGQAATAFKKPGEQE